MTTTTVTLDLPPTFYDDHVSRDLPAGTEIKRTQRYVRVELTREAYDDLLSDARHYSEPDPSWTIRYDAHLLAISRSARATVKRLEAIEPPDGTIVIDEVFDDDDPEIVAEFHPTPTGSIPFDRTPGMHRCYLPDGESVAQPGSTSRRIHGPCWLKWTAYHDGGIDASVEPVARYTRPSIEAINDMRLRRDALWGRWRAMNPSTTAPEKQANTIARARALQDYLAALEATA